MQSLKKTWNKKYGKAEMITAENSTPARQKNTEIRRLPISRAKPPTWNTASITEIREKSLKQ